jgi:hypothetical protein
VYLVINIIYLNAIEETLSSNQEPFEVLI